MEWIALPGTQIEISREPVSWIEYARYARAQGRHPPLRHGGTYLPVTYVTASEADVFAGWYAAGAHAPCRLPTLDEMCQVAELARHDLDAIWPWWSRERQIATEDAEFCLSEWLVDTSETRDTGKPLRTIVFPPWLLEHGNRVPQAALEDNAYDFVTFRLVRELGRGQPRTLRPPG